MPLRRGDEGAFRVGESEVLIRDFCVGVDVGEVHQVFRATPMRNPRRLVRSEFPLLRDSGVNAPSQSEHGILRSSTGSGLALPNEPESTRIVLVLLGEFSYQRRVLLQNGLAFFRIAADKDIEGRRATPDADSSFDPVWFLAKRGA